MECPICKNGSTKRGITTLTVDRNGAIIFFKDVPALICENCGETFIESPTAKMINKLATEAFNKGAEIEVVNLSKVA